MNKKANNKGFTLIELMVATTIFSIVMLVAVGSLLSIADANRKAQALKSVMNNLNFALESMSRNIRVGTNYHCEEDTTPDPDIAIARDCNEGGVLLGIRSSAGDQLIYRYDSAEKRLERSIDGGAFTPITAPEVEIDKFNFYVLGSTPFSVGENVTQPRVIITIQGTAGVKEKEKTTFNVQASVSQRLIDI